MSSVDREALQILETVLETEDPAEQRSLIAERCGEREDLRARVLQLLARLGESPGAFATETFLAARPEPLRIPDRIGPYRITGEIAHGGMGAVLAAERDDGVFQQKVAIKLLRSDISSEASRKRFDEERRILARLRHPGIVRILDGGEQESQPWLAMDFVEGQPVTEALAARKASRAERLAVFETICDAVAYAHRQLVIHADLKPSNVLLGMDGQIHLLDFGIARLMVGLDGAAGAGPHPLTRAYAAPERADGAPPTVQSDVYSLGVMLAEMLTGALPPDGSAPRVGDRDLEAILARARAAELDVRYPDVTSLQQDIARHRQHLPVLARGDAGWRYVAGKFLRRHRVSVAATSLAIVALATATGIAAVQRVAAVRAQAEAEARFDQVRALARYLLFDLYDQLGQSPGTVATRVEVAALAHRYLDALSQVPHAPRELRFDTAAAYRRLAQVLGVSGTASLGRPEEANEALDRASALVSDALRTQPRDADWQELAGWIESDRWALLTTTARSDETNLRARRHFEAALELDPGRVSARLGLLGTQRAEAYVHIKGSDRQADARALLERTLAELRALDVPEPLRQTAALLEYQTTTALGDALYYGGDSAASLPQYEAALRIADARLEQRTADPAWLSRRGEALWNISGVLEESPARLPEALAAAERGIVSLRRVLDYGPDANAEKKLAILHSQQGMLLARQGKGPAAIEAIRHSIDIRTARLAAAPEDGTRLRDLVIGQMSYSEVLAGAGDRRRACEVARDAVHGWQRIEARGELTEHDRKASARRATEDAERRCADRP